MGKGGQGFWLGASRWHSLSTLQGEEHGLWSWRNLSPNTGCLLASWVPGVNYLPSGFLLRWVFNECKMPALQGVGPALAPSSGAVPSRHNHCSTGVA